MELTDKLEEQVRNMERVGAAGAKGKTVKQVVSVKHGVQLLVLFTDGSYLALSVRRKRNGDYAVEAGGSLWAY